MSEVTKDELLELLIKAIPYAEHLSKLQTQHEGDFIIFTWRGGEYKMTTSFLTCELDGCIGKYNDASLLMEALVKRAYIDSLSQNKESK